MQTLVCDLAGGKRTEARAPAQIRALLNLINGLGSELLCCKDDKKHAWAKWLIGP